MPPGDRARLRDLSPPSIMALSIAVLMLLPLRVEGAASGPIRVDLTLPNCCFPDHPMARDLPARFRISQTEMYDEPFHVPPPDEVVFEERWEGGEWFRSGMVWNLGKGRIVYFRPGHETYPVYADPTMLRVLSNACLRFGER